jgi:nicotinamidase/pyrazinamidase
MKTIFFDIDTQIDFAYPAGALYAPGAEEILPLVAELNRRAPLVISTMDAHSEDDPEFKLYGHHCVAGTLGQRKPAATLIEARALLTDGVGEARQIILEKQNVDCFTNPLLAPLLAEQRADRYIVYGLVTDVCVRHAIFGLLKTGKRVELVADAVRGFDQEKARKTIEEFRAGGGTVISAADALTR